MNIGALIQGGGVWIGGHYSKYNKRLCLNLIPCVTIFICFKGGVMPQYKNILLLYKGF